MNAFDYAENASGRTCSDQHSAFGAIRFNQRGIHRMSLAHTTILGGKTKRHVRFDAESSFLDFFYSRTASWRPKPGLAKTRGTRNHIQSYQY